MFCIRTVDQHIKNQQEADLSQVFPLLTFLPSLHSHRQSVPSLGVNISRSEQRLRSRPACCSSTAMAPAGELTAVWITVLLAALGAQLGETKTVFPYVPFPPALPITENLAAICQDGGGRPRYPDSFFPPSGYSHDRRRGAAINRLESWFGLCCSGLVAQQPSQVLCCAQQAWVQALSQFCQEESSTKTVLYECCEDKGPARWICFNSELPNPDYSPKPGYTAPAMPQEPGFSFNPNVC